VEARYKLPLIIIVAKQNSYSEHALGIEEKIKGYVFEDRSRVNCGFSKWLQHIVTYYHYNIVQKNLDALVCLARLNALICRCFTFDVNMPSIISFQ